MDTSGELSRVRALSDGDLLSGLCGAVGRSRRAISEVVVHLGEVEERRLHLLGGYGSLFAYCVSRLAMSEDEAYRRIEVARLVRRFPMLLDRLVNAHISLSVAVLLKPHLTDANCVSLLDAVSEKTVAQAREVLAAWYPKPDILPSIRKLPAPFHPAGAPVSAVASSATAVPVGEPSGLGAPRAAPPLITMGPPRRAIEPLSAGRYKLQLMAGVELKRKLELARDLLRHAIPSGDLSAIVERALDLLLERTLKRRHGATSRRKPDASASHQAASPSIQAATHHDQTMASQRIENEPSISKLASGGADPTTPAALDDPAADSASHPASAAATPQTARASQSNRQPTNSVRRSVLARDGMRCSWCGPDGVQCTSTAWLEHDHTVPFALGGSSEACNIRLLCKAHNRLAAERAYGRHTIRRSIARQRERASSTQPSPESAKPKPTPKHATRSPLEAREAASTV